MIIQLSLYLCVEHTAQKISKAYLNDCRLAVKRSKTFEGSLILPYLIFIQIKVLYLFYLVKGKSTIDL